jgi:hypothetical protein
MEGLDFRSIPIVRFRRRSIWDRNIPHNPIVIDASNNLLAVLVEARFPLDPGNESNLGRIGR